MKAVIELMLLTMGCIAWFLTMHYGWGLSIVSWPWIIGGFLWSLTAFMIREYLRPRRE